MFRKDGITYESEQEYQYAKQNNAIEPKKAHNCPKHIAGDCSHLSADCAVFYHQCLF